MWVEIGKTPLNLLYLEPYKTIQETNIQAGWSKPGDPNYGYYYPVVLFITSIEAAIVERDKKILEYKEQSSILQKANEEISNGLLMSNNFTEDQLIRLSAFLREDELHLDDIVETSQDSLVSSFKVKQDAMESGKIELQKRCQPQLQFSMSMANIYALPEFEPIVDQFQLGKVIKVGLRTDYIKQSRLLQVDINFDDFSDFSCEFGELTSLRTQSDIHADLLSQAISAGKSVATNSSYWTRGSDQATATNLKIQQGLLDATTQIKSIDGTQGVVIDKYGIHLQNINPTTGEIDPKQGWITNNKFLYSDDGFKSTKSVFGEYAYDGETYYGILAEALVGNLLIGSQIKLENNNGTMTFDNNGLTVTNGTNAFQVNPNAENLLVISNETGNIFYVDDKGILHIVGDGAGLDIQSNDSITGLSARITLNEEAIGMRVTSDDVESMINLKKDEIIAEVGTPDELVNSSVVINTDGVALTGGTVEVNAGVGVNINSEGSINIKSGGAMNIDSRAELTLKSGGAMNIESDATITVESGGSMDIASGGELTINSGASLKIVGGSVEISSSGTFNITSGGAFTIDSEGTFTVQSDAALQVASGGTVQISAGNGDDSFIDFGEAFAVDKNGVTATIGNFTSLKVTGNDVLTKEYLNSKVIVSTKTPNETGVIWLCPTSVTSVEYKKETPNLRDITAYIANTTKTFSVECNTQDVLTGGPYTYTVKFPVYLALDGESESNLKFQVTATKSTDPSLKIEFPEYTIASLKAWQLHNVEITLDESSVNLCTNTDPINVAITCSNAKTYMRLYINKDSYVYFNSTDTNATGSTQPCSVYYIP